MTLDWWGLGLQAVNVLILVWLLGRVFWRPVAEAIDRRQKAAQGLLDEGKAAQVKADAALADAREARAGIAAERDAMLAEATAAAQAAATAVETAARTKAEALIAASLTAIDNEKTKAQKDNAGHAAALSVEIAARLLGPFRTPEVQATFLVKLVDAIAGMSATDRAGLVAAADDIDIVTATEAKGAEKTAIERAVKKALGKGAAVRLVIDPDLLAGVELRSPHFVLRNSWRADLDGILKEVKDAF